MTHELLSRHLPPDMRHVEFLTSASARNMSENRKRSREDDSCEFMPLSKRINNLHINNSERSLTHPTANTAPPRPSYDPGLTPEQSQYYYNNKLLFDLYIERLQRMGEPFPQ